MRDARPSFTAAYVAACRGLGRALEPDARLVDDPWAARFVGRAMGRALDVVAWRGGDPIRAAAVSRVPLVLYMQVRTRAIDDVVSQFAREGGRQVVLLGAGFDARATRFPALSFFEVDHPATQGRKREVLGYEEPGTYVAWNFEREPMKELPAALAAHGHDPTRPTLTIWEGVTMYLTEPAIDASVAAVRAYGAPGSMLAMTYFDRARLEGRTRQSAFRRLTRAAVAAVGEPFRFGWEPDELPSWLRARGLELESDRDLGDVARALLPERYARRVKPGNSRLAVARASLRTP